MAYLFKIGFVDILLTDNLSVIAYGICDILYNFDKSENCMIITKDMIHDTLKIP